MGQMLKLPLTPICFRVAHIDGSILKTLKSLLLKELKT